MSLLLEALKKAELAKQSAQSGTENPDAPALQLEETAAPVFTREKLPDISQPLEILTDDLPSAGAKPAAAPKPREPEIVPSIEAPAPRKPPASERPVTAQRDAARNMFEAKAMNYNPRRPFQLTVGALVLCALCYGGYLWWQMQPRSSFNAQALRQTQQASASQPTPITTAPAASAPAPKSAPSPVDSATTARVRPGRTATAPVNPPARREPANALFRPAMEREPARPEVAVAPATSRLDPLLERAWEALQKGDLAVARDAYGQVIAREPNNRDALLGLAAIDVHMHDYVTAEMRYQKLLEMDPRDAQANAALIALRGQPDPVLAESRVKTLIAGRPEATFLYFTLGNQFAQQSRWPEAQAAYFKAYTADPGNPDFAFNLAISLDRLRQTKPALDYYRRALELAATHPANFERAQVEARIAELSK